MPDLRSLAVGLAFILGAVAAISGAAHWVAVTTKAIAEGRGYDARLATLLGIGFLPVGFGIAMVVGAVRASSDPASGLLLVATSCGLFAAILIVMFPALSAPPNGSAGGTAGGIAAYAVGAVLAWVAR